MTQYRKKPVVIEAYQLPIPPANGNNTEAWERATWAFIAWAKKVGLTEFIPGDTDGAVKIPTLEGMMNASPGDWIIKGVKGEFYPCKPDIFGATYEPASEPETMEEIHEAERNRVPFKLPSDPTLPAASDAEPVAIYVEARECGECNHVGINDSHPTDAACGYPCGWTGPSPKEDKCPGCGREGVMSAACPKCSGHYRLLADLQVNSAASPAIRNSRIAGDGEAGAEMREALEVVATWPITGKPSENMDAHNMALVARAALEAAPPEKQTSHSEGDAGGDERPAWMPKTDRAMLEATLNDLDISSWECRQCGHSEPCKDMDAALMLRDYLAAPTVPHSLTVAQGDERAPIPDDCDVRKIMLRVDPGDGDGYEVYAKNVSEVEELLSEMGRQLEDFEIARDAALERQQGGRDAEQIRDAALAEAAEILVGIETTYKTYASGYPRRQPQPRPAAAVIAEAVVAINAARAQRAGKEGA